MGWTSYYTNNTNKEECLEIVKRFRGTCKKTVMKGNQFYALMTSPKGEDWVLLLLTQRHKGEFYYKDIQCNPYEHGIPMSILKDFKPSNKQDEDWLKDNLEIAAEEKKKTDYDIGDILHCVNNTNYPITWDSYSIAVNEEFYVMVDVLNPFAKRKTKMFRVVKLNDLFETLKKGGSSLTEEEVLQKYGKRFTYQKTYYRISTRAMKLIKILNKEN